jgi:hypothetical protein
MPKYLLTYHGGATPEGMSEDEVQAVMGKWMAWMGGLGDALTDRGNAVKMSKTVTASGVEDGGGANPATGYSTLEAADIDAAMAMAKDCPIFESGGTVEVGETVQM